MANVKKNIIVVVSVFLSLTIKYIHHKLSVFYSDLRRRGHQQEEGGNERKEEREPIEWKQGGGGGGGNGDGGGNGGGGGGGGGGNGNGNGNGNSGEGDKSNSSPKNEDAEETKKVMRGFMKINFNYQRLELTQNILTREGKEISNRY